MFTLNSSHKIKCTFSQWEIMLLGTSIKDESPRGRGVLDIQVKTV